MKKTRIAFAAFAFFAPFLLAIILLSGCAVDPITGKSKLNIWNTSTNASGQVVMDLSPEAKAWIEAAQGANALNVTPSQPLVGWGITAVAGILSGVGSWMAGRKNGKKAPENGMGAIIRAIEATPLNPDIENKLRGLIESAMQAGKSVETIIGELRQIDWKKDLKSAIQLESTKSGVATTVHQAVVKNTK